MNINEFSDAIAQKTGLDRKGARQMVEAVFETIVMAASTGEEVSLPSFGKFSVTAREARQGRNPATGETIQIAASKKLAFAASKQVKTTLNPPPAPKSAAKPGKAASPSKKAAKRA